MMKCWVLSYELFCCTYFYISENNYCSSYIPIQNSVDARKFFLLLRHLSTCSIWMNVLLFYGGGNLPILYQKTRISFLNGSNQNLFNLNSGYLHIAKTEAYQIEKKLWVLLKCWNIKMKTLEEEVLWMRMAYI